MVLTTSLVLLIWPSYQGCSLSIAMGSRDGTVRMA